MHSKRETYHARALERLRARLCHVDNQRLAQEFLTTRQARDAALATQVNYLRALVALETHLGARSYGDAAAADLSAFFAALVREKKLATVAFYSKALLAFYRWLLGDEPMKNSFRASFRVATPPGRTLIVTDAEFAALLHACLGTQDRALLWLLRDSGLRLGEAHVLNVGDVAFDEKAGATLDLREKRLKTRPSNRRVYVTRCVPILRALLADHPAGAKAEAPLFVHAREPLRGRRLEHADLDGMIRRARARSGIGKNVTAHVFRHTRATELSRNGWGNAAINLYMGWSPTSRMIARYTHLTLEDLEQRVRHDAGYDDPALASVTPAAVPAPTAIASAEAQAFAQAFGLAWRLAKDASPNPLPT